MRGELAVWDTWQEFDSLQRRITRMFEETMRALSPVVGGEELARGVCSQAVDIYETGESFVIRADLPGVSKDDIHIAVKDNVLTLRGEKKFEEKVSRDNYIRIERSYGSFVRSFTLPQNVDLDRIKAHYKDGVLEVTIPKKEEAKPKQIKVEAS